MRYNLDRKAPMQLYNLAEDPGEEHDLAAENPDLTEHFDSLMRVSRTDSDLFNFDYRVEIH